MYWLGIVCSIIAAGSLGKFECAARPTITDCRGDYLSSADTEGILLSPAAVKMLESWLKSRNGVMGGFSNEGQKNFQIQKGVKLTR